MKMNKLLAYLFLLLPALTLQSCLKNQEDVFPESSAAQMKDYLDKTKDVLASSEKGWVLDMYPDKTRKYGGFAFVLKFDADKVTVGSELSPNPSNLITSLYKTTADDGPVLTFDTYNAWMHYLATPSSDRTTAFGGDFEFVIDSIGSDLIVVHGKRNQNVMYFRKLTDQTMTEYLTAVKKMKSTFKMSEGKGRVGDKKVVMKFSNHRLNLSVGDKEVASKVAYTLTDKGIRFYSPLDFNGVKVSEMTFDAEGNKLTAKEDANIVLYGFTPQLSKNDDAFERELYVGDDIQSVTTSEGSEWLTVTKTSNGIKVSAPANTSGHINKAVIKVKTADGESTITVTQADFDKDVAGNYTLYFNDFYDAAQTTPATISRESDGKILMKWTTSGVPVTIELTWNSEKLALDMESRQLIGKSLMSSGDTWYFYNIFFYEGNQWSGYNGKFTCSFPLSYTKNAAGTYETSGALTGKSSLGGAVEAIWMSAFKGEGTDAGNYLGSYESFKKLKIVKN